MQEIDPIRIRALLNNIAKARNRLIELGQLPLSEFLNDFRNTESAKYLLIVATEAAIDTCHHIVARQNGIIPESYADCFTQLANLQVIQADLAQSLHQIAHLRNMLVYLYWQIDNSQIYHIIHHNLNDLDEFRQQINDWI